MNEEQLLNELKALRAGRLPRSVYLILAAGAIVLTALLWRSSLEHAREDARRDAIEQQEKSEIARVRNEMTASDKVADAKVAEIRKQKEAAERDLAEARREIMDGIPWSEDKPAVVEQPAQPAKTSVQAPAELSPAPSAVRPKPGPVLQLNPTQQHDLARYEFGCDECRTERDRLKTALKGQAEITERTQHQLDEANKASHGGSVWQRTWRVIRPVGCGGAGAGVGAVAAGPKGAIVGSVGAALACAIFAK